jgi:hypothetical protein
MRGILPLGSSLVALSAACLVACAGPPPPAAPAAPAARNGYALLFEILGQEKDVSKILVIHGERDEVQALIDEIAETTGAACDRLEELGEADPHLNLKDTGLPSAEVATREAVKDTRTKLLVTDSGKEFELQLLLAQNEALSYSSHLAEVLARAEPDADRLAFVRQLYKDLSRLQQELLALVRASYRYVPSS